MSLRRSALTAGLLAAITMLAGAASAMDAVAPVPPAQSTREFVIDLPVSMDGRTVGQMTVTVGDAGLAMIDATSWQEFGARQFAPDVVQGIADRAVAGSSFPASSRVRSCRLTPWGGQGARTASCTCAPAARAYPRSRERIQCATCG